MDSTLTIRIQKAGIISCLFLCILPAVAQQTAAWLGEPAEQTAWRQALNLNFTEARKTIQKKTTTTESIYLASLCDALELLITEDESRFDTFEDAYEERLQALSKLSPKTPQVLHASAELRLQWAFVYLKFGHEFDAAWNIRQCYALVQDCLNKYPSFTPIQKTSGLLNIMLGSVPDKYQWVLSVLSMHGSVEKGIAKLQSLQRSDNPVVATEASLMLYLAQGLILQQPHTALQALSEWPPDNHTRMSLFLAAVLAIKNSESEKALTYLETLKTRQEGLAFAYADYLSGEVYLHKGEYNTAITAYQNFLKNYTGDNFIKDSYYKTAVCYWLLGNKPAADEFAAKARISGREYAEADRHAAKSLTEKEFPNPLLLKIRYATDGGYYEMAEQVTASVNPDELRTRKEQTEFVYRKARLYHKLNKPEACKPLYQQTISMSGDNPWYFAPNACLQLGYLYMAEGDKKQAAFYFRKALSYKKHDYKNSIDSKARSALGQVHERK